VFRAKGGENQAGHQQETGEVDQEKKAVAMGQNEDGHHQPFKTGSAPVHSLNGGGEPVPAGLAPPMEQARETVHEGVVVGGGVKGAAQKNERRQGGERQRERPGETPPEAREGAAARPAPATWR